MMKRAGYIFLALVACAMAFWLGRLSVAKHGVEVRNADAVEVLPQPLSPEDITHARRTFRTRKAVPPEVSGKIKNAAGDSVFPKDNK